MFTVGKLESFVSSEATWPEICDSQRFETGARVSKKIPTTHAFLHQITYSKLWRAA